MKRSLAYVLVLAVMLTALGIWGINTGTKTATAADTVSYWLPYLTTDTNAPVYCMVSNMADIPKTAPGSDDNVTSINFTVMANTVGNTSRAASTPVTFAQIAVRKTRLMTFSGQSIYLDASQTHDLSANTGTGSVAGYGGRLDFIASNAVGAATATVAGSNVRSTFNCTTMNMACYQGTTSPKRNVVGYQCSDSGISTFITSGAVNANPGLFAY
ncbi:MAG: hypothetical protein HQK96_18145 [Nitrospirae bacterium]|nr:hypothetical protein [Nitrospirota bacterium]